MKINTKFWSILYLISVSLIDFMGLGIVVTLFPKLFLDPSLGLLPQAMGHSERLILIGVFLSIYPIGQFFGAAIFGKWSDHFGRKPMLVITLIGTIVGFIISSLALTYYSVVTLLIGRIISGLFAGNAAIAQASIIDLSTSSNKAKNITILQVTLGFAWVIGPPLGGWLSQDTVVSWFNYATPFWFITILLCLILMITIIFFKETIKEKHVLDSHYFNQFSGFTNLIRQRQLRYLFIIWGLFVSGWWLFEAYLPTFLLQEWHLGPAGTGTFLGCMGFGYAITQIIGMRFLHRVPSEALVIYSLCFSALAVVLMAVVTAFWGLILVTALYVITMAFALPGLITNISNAGSARDQGHIMGLVSSIQAMATVLMMLLGGPLVAISYKIPIIGGGGLLGLSWLVFLVYVPFRCFKITRKSGAAL